MNVRECCLAARADSIPVGEAGRWKIKKFTVSEEASKLNQMQNIFNGSGRYCPPGDYTGIFNGGFNPVMSDTNDELRDLHEVFSHGTGRIIVNGLGLGCVVRGLLVKPSVMHIDVVEIDADVISLVGPTFADEPRVTIHEGDAFTFKWPKGAVWDCAWHDVWPALCVDNLSNEEHADPGTYAKLNRRYGRRVAWQGAWGHELLKSQQRQENRRTGWF